MNENLTEESLDIEILVAKRLGWSVTGSDETDWFLHNGFGWSSARCDTERQAWGLVPAFDCNPWVSERLCNAISDEVGCIELTRVSEKGGGTSPFVWTCFISDATYGNEWSFLIAGSGERRSGAVCAAFIKLPPVYFPNIAQKMRG